MIQVFSKVLGLGFLASLLMLVVSEKRKIFEALRSLFKKKAFQLIGQGAFLSLVFLACTSATYHFYTVDIEGQTFRGKDKNIPFADCKKQYDSTGKLSDGAPCIMVPREEYIRLKNDWDVMKITLVDLQKRCK